MPSARYAERLGRTDSDTDNDSSVVQPESATPKALVVGAADDRAEIEADRVAGEVIARLQGGTGPVHQHSAGCGHGGLRRFGRARAGAEVGLDGGPISADLSARIDGKRGGGSALPDDVRGRMEQGFGGSLADVRVHRDAESASLNRAVSARAFTTGKDIFFGTGEYRPDTAEGEQVLAHEIAHTRQAGGGAHRTAIRRWDIRGNVDLSTGQNVGVVSSGQAVFFVEDNTGDKLVVKAEKYGKVGLSEIGSALHINISKAKTVRHRKLGAADVNALAGLIADEGRLDQAAWAKLGKRMRVDYPDLAERLGPEATDVQVGVNHQTDQMGTLRGDTWLAMDYASGSDVEEEARTEDTDAYSGQKNALRRRLSNRQHVTDLGRLTAVDLFLGNADRLRYANLGNWLYDPLSEATTLIDHVDGSVRAAFRDDPMAKSTLENDPGLKELAKAELRNTATGCVSALAGAMAGTRFRSPDPDFAAWLDEGAGNRRKAMVDDLAAGLLEGRKQVIKTFSSTRFSGGKKGKQARAAKKSIKATAREAQQTDESGVDYYAVLKARAAYLAKT